LICDIDTGTVVGKTMSAASGRPMLSLGEPAGNQPSVRRDDTLPA
jgi:hypothetical protein